MKAASQAMKYEVTPVRSKLRKSINKQKFDEMLLGQANDWALLRRFVQKHESVLTYLLAIGVGFVIGLAV